MEWLNTLLRFVFSVLAKPAQLANFISHLLLILLDPYSVIPGTSNMIVVRTHDYNIIMLSFCPLVFQVVPTVYSHLNEQIILSNQVSCDFLPCVHKRNNLCGCIYIISISQAAVILCYSFL